MEEECVPGVPLVCPAQALPGGAVSKRSVFLACPWCALRRHFQAGLYRRGVCSWCAPGVPCRHFQAGLRLDPEQAEHRKEFKKLKSLDKKTKEVGGAALRPHPAWGGGALLVHQ